MITFDATDVASTTVYIGEIFTDLKPIIFVYVGVTLAFVIVGQLIGFFVTQGRIQA
ncbi:unnamed protein product, partial [marine sediment metagenome]